MNEFIKCKNNPIHFIYNYTNFNKDLNIDKLTMKIKKSNDIILYNHFKQWIKRINENNT